MGNDRVLDDIMNIGGGSIMGSSSLAAPVLPTTIEPEPPPPQPEYMGMGPAPAQSGGSKTMIFVLAAALGLVVIAFGGYLVFSKSKGTDSSTNGKTPAAASDTSKPATGPATSDTAAASTATPESSAAAADSGKPDDKKDPLKTNPADKVPGKLEPYKTDPNKVADTKKPDEKKADEKKPDEKTPPPPDPAGPSTAPFDRGAAISSLNAAAGGASGCKKPDGPTGTGRVAVTFAPTGRVTSANVEGPPFAGTSVGGCVAARFRGASVPAFAGSPVTVHKSFSIN
jgi:hypothetical protein